MKYIFILAMFSFSIIMISCDEKNELVGSDPDPLIDRDIAEARVYDLTTPIYGIQVSIREDVGLGVNTILNILDNRAEAFLNCQFNEGSQLGFDDALLSTGETIGPLSELRVFVVPKKFECNAVGLNVCTGIYFFGNDIITVSSSSIGDCPNLGVWKHELGHRYGMEADHSNLRDFRSCTDENNCSFGDAIGF